MGLTLDRINGERKHTNFSSMYMGALTRTEEVTGLPRCLSGKESASNAEDVGLIPALGRSPGGRHGNPTPGFLPGESPWTEEPGGLQSTGSQGVGHDLVTKQQQSD